MPQVEERKFVTCQPGPQTEAMKSKADVCLMGGANGGGKSYWLLLEAARHIDVQGYRAVIFRRESTDITDPGGMWDCTMGVYPQIGGWPRSNKLDWVFEPDARVSFRGLPYFKDAVAWDGKELAFIGFDECQLFTEMQFWYLFGRMRSTCGVNSCIRMTCNPVHEDDPTGGWLKRLIGWWLNWETGYPIPERSGVLRWFCRLNNEIYWADSATELIEQYGDPDLPADHELQTVQPMSLTFIPSKLKDNPILLKKTPQYRASLLALPEHLKQQKLDGNWNAKLQAGTFFKIGNVQFVDAIPANLRYCRAWDLAHTEGAGDWTVGAKVGTDGKGTFYVTDMVRGQWEVGYRDAMMKLTAETDDSRGDDVRIRIPEDPSAGKSEAIRLVKLLRGHTITKERVINKKEVRAAGFASQFNVGNVKLLRAPWNAGLLQRLDAFPTKGIPDDECDALSDSFEWLCRGGSGALVGTGDAPKPEDQPAKHPFASMLRDHIRELWEDIIVNQAVCPHWKGSFAAFRDDIGERPTDLHKLQLRDPNDFYSPQNCYWGVEGEAAPIVRKKAALFSAG